MVYGVGIDIVEVKRFASFDYTSARMASKIFSVAELEEYKTVARGDEFLASRFAAKEAFYKALSSSIENFDLSFAFIRKHVEVVKRGEVPILRVNWDAIKEKIEVPKFKEHLVKTSLYKTSLSISHEKSYAVAIVILS